MIDMYEETNDWYWIEFCGDSFTIHAPHYGGMIKTYKSRRYAEKFCRKENSRLADIKNDASMSIISMLNKEYVV